MAQSIVASLPHELTNLFLFFACILKVGCCTGLIVVPFALIGHEIWKRVYRG